MERGLYIAAAGMLAELARQDQIANDLANAQTPGYKRDEVSQASFGELILANRMTGQVVGPLGVGPLVTSTETDLTPESLRESGEKLDIALSGEGAFVVQTAAGVRYTRDGQLALAPDGTLVTASGHPIVGEDGNPIRVSGADRLEVAPDGSVIDAGTKVGTIAVVSLTAARKEGDGLFSGTSGGRPEGTLVRQGFLETSAVNAAETMVDMIVSLRAFEAAQRVIRAIDETLQRGINSVGSSTGTG
jgi:flagellar basal-body rod protein FlgG